VVTFCLQALERFIGRIGCLLYGTRAPQSVQTSQHVRPPCVVSSSPPDVCAVVDVLVVHLVEAELLCGAAS